MAKRKLTEEEKEIRSSERKKRIDKVFIWILVLFLICGIGYASFIIYKNGGIKFLNNNKETKEKEKEETSSGSVKEVKTDGDFLHVNNYLLELDNQNNLVSLYDLDGNKVKDYGEDFNLGDLYSGENGEIYNVDIEFGDGYVNNVILYDLTGKKDDKVLELDGNHSYFVPLCYDGKDYNRRILLGFVETVFDENGDETYKIHYLNGEEVELGSYQIDSISQRLDMETPFEVRNDKYAVVSDYNKTNAKYGVIDLKTGDLVIACNYNFLYQTYDNTFVAKMDGKTGIIDLKTKKILPYEYDFIDVNEDYYIVGKDDKLAILDSNYKFVTDFVFDYQKLNKDNTYLYKVCCASFNTFYSFKHGDKYLLVINAQSGIMGIDYDKNEAYIINSDGKYETVKEHDVESTLEFTYFYDIDDKLVSIYDEDFEHVSDISLKDYDISKDSILYVYKYEDVIYINSDGLKLYFDYETGEELDEAIVHYTYNNMELEVNLKDKEIRCLKDKKEVKDIDKKIDLDYLEINKLKNGGYVLIDDKRFIIMK